MSVRRLSPLFLILCLLPVALHAGLPAPTDEACAEFGREIAAAIQDDNADEFTRRADTIALTERMLRGIDLALPERIGMHAGLAMGLKKTFTHQFTAYSTASYRFTKTIGDEKRVYIRLLGEDGSFCILAIVCVAYSPGHTRWMDFFSYTTGELFSETLRRIMLPMLVTGDRTKQMRLKTADQSYLQNITSVQTALAMKQNGDSSGALALLEALPQEFREQKFIIGIRHQVSLDLDDATCIKIIEEWERLYPEDPALDVISIDSTFLRKDYAGTIARLDSLSRRIGQPDAYLLNLKASMYNLMEKPDEARATAAQALSLEPTLPACYDTVLTLALKRRDFTEISGTLALFEKHFPESDINTLIQTEPQYADYLKSDEYRAWINSRPGRPAEKKPDETPAEKKPNIPVASPGQ